MFTFTKEIEVDAKMASEIQADIETVAGLIRQLNASLVTFAAEVATIGPAKLAEYIRDQVAEIARLLDSSVQTRYRSDVGLIHGALVDRAIVTAQAAMLKALQERKRGGIQVMVAEIERIMAILGSLIEVIETEVTADGR